MQRKQIIQTVKKLRAYRNVSFPVLSVYLTNKNQACGGKLAEDFRRLIKQTAVANEEKLLEKEMQTIEAYLTEDYDIRKHCCNIAIFAGERLWEIIHHEFPIPEQLAITHHPYITPLLHELYNEGEDLVIVADKKHTKLLLFHNGVIDRQEELADGVLPRHIKSNKGENYARSTKLFRNRTNKLNDHFGNIANEVGTFVKNRHIHAVFIGGNEPIFHVLEGHLTTALRKKIRGEFIVSLKATPNELLRKSQHVIAHAAI
ncbi:MAG: hypothetical protein KGJ07_06185 [Patescibacteria group bacterium]|nr:hypothetical protein [Patescibacteria group bacterium]